MTAYIWPLPKQVAFTPIPTGVAGGSLELLRSLPRDQAAVLEFESATHLSAARNVLSILAYRELGFRLRTQRVRGIPECRLLIWRMDAEVARNTLGATGAVIEAALAAQSAQPAPSVSPLQPATLPVCPPAPMDWLDPRNLI